MDTFSYILTTTGVLLHMERSYLNLPSLSINLLLFSDGERPAVLPPVEQPPKYIDLRF